METALVDEEPRVTGMARTDGRDPASFAALYQEHRLTVYRYLRARVPTDADALDLAADTFERAFMGFARFRPHDGGARAWLLRVARNAAIDAHRRRRSTVELERAAHHLGHLAVEADRVSREHDPIVDLVASLSPVQQEVLILRYASGLTAREIGTVIGKREAAVQKQIERGLATLREDLDDHAR